MVKNKYLSFVIILLITFLASGIGGFTTSFYKDPWYSQIILQTYNPPSWVFGPVWTTLYIIMSVAAWSAWNKTFDTKIMYIYFVHLFFNAIWSVIFFGFHKIGLALIDLIIIIFFIIILMKTYFKINKLSFYLFLPYFIWSSYALVLNGSIFLLN